MSLPGVVVEMPGGVWRNGARRRDARLRALDARRAVAFAEDPTPCPPVVFATRLLAHCLAELAGQSPVTEDSVRALTAGDREALLLHFHRLTFGDRIDLAVVCPSCQERLDISVRSSELLVVPYRHAPGIKRRTLDAGGQAAVVRFRLPIGADLEAAIRIGDDQDAAQYVASRCVQAVSPAQNIEALLESIEGLMAELDPQSELRFNLRCPECEANFSAVLDMASHVRGEVGAQAKTLIWEVHTIASAYHWSESDILALTPGRRQHYLELIDAYGAAG